MDVRDFLKHQQTKEVLRFIFTGVVNTLVGFLFFVAIQFLVGTYITYIGSLLLAHFCSSTVAFILYRLFVFRAEGSWLRQYWKFQSVYAVPLLFNILLLPVMVSAFKVNVYLAQAVSLVLIAIGSYFAHKFFTFRKPKPRSSTEHHR